MVRLKPRGTILQNPLSLQIVVESLPFCVRLVAIWLFFYGLTIFKYEGLDVFLKCFVGRRLSK